MSALGLAGYSSSDAEDENTRVDVHESTKAGLENTSVADNPRDAHVQASASKQIAPGIFSSFGRSKRKGKHSRGGLPLFSKPVGADNGSDSDDDLGQRYKRLRPDTVAEGRLSFLPKPVHALPIHEEDQAPKLELAASQPDIVSFVDTSEMYRVDGRTSPAASIAMDSTPLAPEALLAQSMKAGQHIEFKEIKADVIQRAAPSEKSEIDALRTAMGSEHAKQVQASAGQHNPSKRQKQRHQLNSLYHKAQMTELQDMEKKLVHTRSKAQTAAKYGW